MADLAVAAGEGVGEDVQVRSRPRRPVRWFATVAKILVSLLTALLVAAAGLFLFLDTDVGHRFLADRVAALSPETGLKIRIGRIEGSIWGETRLRDVRASDPQGLFLESPQIDVEWRPLAWISNRLIIDDLASDLVVLHRLPKLLPSEKPRPILPGFDVRVGRLSISKLRLEKGVSGQLRMASVSGEADIRSGRALVDLNALVEGGDRLALKLDAEPDRDHFDVDVRLDAPANGVAAALLGTQRPIRLRVEGDGRWSAWAGRAEMDLSGRRAADLGLRAANGVYTLSGSVAPAPFVQGKLAALTAPTVLVNARSTLQDRRLQGSVSLRSSVLKVESRGIVDLAASGFEDVQIGADLLKPESLFQNMSGSRVRLTALLNGPFAEARFAYRITSPRVAFAQTGLEDVRAEGRGRFSKSPVTVPVLLTARRVTGVGQVTGGILANLRLDGVLKVASRRLSGEGLTFTSDKLKGKLALLVDFATGRFDVVLSGGLTRYLVPGLGLVDVLSELKVVPAPGGKGTLVTGRGRAWVRRFDNRFLSGLAGGLPQLETRIVRTNDGIVRFVDLKLTAPNLRIAGNGYRRKDGSFWLEGTGRQARYGQFAMNLDGRIERPKLAIRLAKPNDAMGLANVLLNLDPTAQGFNYRAAGLSRLGPFTSRGAIRIAPGAPALIQVAALSVSGTGATGLLRADPGGFTGHLNVAGGGLDGRLLFSPVGQVQRVEAHLEAQNARFAGPPAFAVQNGRVDGVMLLDPAGTSIEGTMNARGFESGGLAFASISAEASLRGGSGRISADLAGSRGRDFNFKTVADVTRDSVRLTGGGSIDRRPIQLNGPAVLTRSGKTWGLAPTALSFAGGSATVSGVFGPDGRAFDAQIQAMPLTVLDILSPGLALGGSASGTVRYRPAIGNGQPSGAADLRIRGLSRAGLVLSSRPVDVGVAARLLGGHAALRAIAVSEGRTVGRAQARLSPLGSSGTIGERLSKAPLFAQVRYNAPIETLWRLTGIDMLDLSGALAVGADLTGTLADPVIRGSLRTEKARLESAITGTVIENIQAAGRFDGPRLVLDSFAGTTKRNGRISGQGTLDLSAKRGFPMALTVDAQAAQLIDRDDLKAQVTGPLTFNSSSSGGTIGGDVSLVNGSFRLGSAADAAQVAKLPVKEINRREDDAPAPSRGGPWRFDLQVRADDRLTLTGLGITSEWGADLKLGGTVSEPRINGRAELVRGSYDFAGRRFDLERGIIRFQGESPINPALDIVAEGGVQGLSAQIRVTGRSQRPEIAFTSIPALPQDELLSRLLFGTSITNLSAPEALQLAAAVASLNESGGGLDPINAVRAATGLDRLRILPADIATGQGTAIAAGKYIGRRVYVEVITDARGYSASRIEYQITRWLSLLSSISTIGRQSVNVRVSRDY